MGKKEIQKELTKEDELLAMLVYAIKDMMNAANSNDLKVNINKSITLITVNKKQYELQASFIYKRNV